MTDGHTGRGPTVTIDDQVQDKAIELNGLRFHYRDWGNEAAPPLLLLHGHTHHARTWDTVARGLADRYRVLAPDLRGHGETDWATEYTPERFAEDLGAFAGALDLRRFGLVGFSLGGHTAYPFAARHPEMVERLVLAETTPEPDPAAQEWLRTWLHQPEVLDDPEAALLGARALARRAPEDELRHWVLGNLKWHEDGRWAWRYDPALRPANRPTVRPDGATLWATVPRLACPTLIVRGAESPMFGRDAAERKAHAIPDGHLAEIPKAGHWVPLDNPEGFLAAVRAFLQEAAA